MIVNRKVRPHCNVCNVLRRSYGAADSIGVYETRNTGAESKDVYIYWQ